eukprot:jgi/Psemu1/47558/gm1.47558_g
MNQFDYAQSNSLLKQEIDGETSSDSHAPSPTSSERVPQWQHELVDHHEIVKQESDSSDVGMSHEGTHMSSIAADVRVERNEAVVVSIASAVGNRSVHATAATNNAIERNKGKATPAKKASRSKYKVTTSVSSISDIGNNPTDQSEKKQKKVRSRKPRRIIPNEKEYIPETEQPTAADIVGGRGANSFNPALHWGAAMAGSGSKNMFPPVAALAALNAVRANAANISNSVNDQYNNNKNKLDFLFNSAGRRPPRQNHFIPTVDDILKHRIDQMPMFSAAAANVPAPNIAAATFANSSFPLQSSIGVPLQSSIGLSAYQSMFPSIGMPGTIGGVATNFANSGVAGDANHGFGAGGNPGAPALPTNAMGSFLPSIGMLQSLDMKSLDSYMEHPTTAMAMGTQTFHAQNANSAKTLDMLKSLVGTSFGSSLSGSTMGTVMSSLSKNSMPAIGATPPMRSTKTDWNAMFNMALSNHKT